MRCDTNVVLINLLYTPTIFIRQSLDTEMRSGTIRSLVLSVITLVFPQQIASDELNQMVFS